MQLWCTTTCWTFPDMRISLTQFLLTGFPAIDCRKIHALFLVLTGKINSRLFIVFWATFGKREILFCMQNGIARMRRSADHNRYHYSSVTARHGRWEGRTDLANTASRDSLIRVHFVNCFCNTTRWGFRNIRILQGVLWVYMQISLINPPKNSHLNNTIKNAANCCLLTLAS